MKKVTIKRYGANGRIVESTKIIDSQDRGSVTKKETASSELTLRTVKSFGEKHKAALTRLANR